MKNITKVHLLIICIVTLLTSCVTSKDTNLLQDIQANYPELTTPPEEYRVVTGDQLNIVVYAWDEETQRLFAGYTPRFSGQGITDRIGVNAGDLGRSLDDAAGVKPVTIYADGTITFPYLGKIYVQGMTILEIRDVISNKLETIADGTTAEVSLYNRFFSILGEVGAGRVTMPNTTLTIYQALSLANSIGPYGDRSKVSIIRQTQDGAKIMTLDLRSKDIVGSEYYYIQPNDVIYIPQMKRKFLGTTDSFTGVFGLLTSLASVIIFTLRIF